MDSQAVYKGVQKRANSLLLASAITPSSSLSVKSAMHSHTLCEWLF